MIKKVFVCSRALIITIQPDMVLVALLELCPITPKMSVFMTIPWATFGDTLSSLLSLAIIISSNLIFD